MTDNAPALDPLLSGYHRFRDTRWQTERDRWAALAKGQSPRVLVIACSDSRVDPATVFDTSPGEIFVVRNVANLVPPFEDDQSHHGVSAALEFAVTQLKVESVVVMGHEFCGGCAASLTQAFAHEPRGRGGFIANWVALLDGARADVAAKHGEGEPALRALEREAVRVSLANLRTFPFVQEAEAAGQLRLTGAWFGIREGRLLLLDEASGTFQPA